MNTINPDSTALSGFSYIHQPRLTQRKPCTRLSTYHFLQKTLNTSDLEHFFNFFPVNFLPILGFCSDLEHF